MIIKTENLYRRFTSFSGTVTAVNNVSIEIQPNHLTMLRGKSGSGKTTLINLMGALDYPSEGKIWFGDREITSMSESARNTLRREKMGFVFQSVALMGDMTAYENVEFEMRIAGMKAGERKRRAEECLDMVGLAERMRHMPQELSGGEQQRVAIARAMSHRPVVIFADEPTAQLDTQMGLQIIKLFLDLAQKEGITLVMTTHDPEIMDIAHRVYTLKDGVISDEL